MTGKERLDRSLRPSNGSACKMHSHWPWQCSRVRSSFRPPTLKHPPQFFSYISSHQFLDMPMLKQIWISPSSIPRTLGHFHLVWLISDKLAKTNPIIFPRKMQVQGCPQRPRYKATILVDKSAKGQVLALPLWLSFNASGLEYPWNSIKLVCW